MNFLPYTKTKAKLPLNTDFHSLPILLLYGGRSAEHEVSCISAIFIFEKLVEARFTVYPVYVAKNGLWYLQEVPSAAEENCIGNSCKVRFVQQDSEFFLEGERDKVPVKFVFPIIHGTNGEDGRLQGMLEFYQIPYAGCSALSSALCMDKWFMREIFKAAHLPQVEYAKLEKKQWEEKLSDIMEKFSYPVFVKPCNMGSSVGVSKVKEQSELKTAIEDAFRYDDHILIEQGVDPEEIEVSILGNFPDYKVSLPGKLLPNHEFYSYEAKYEDENGAHFEIPANLEESVRKEVQEMAKKAFAAVRGEGFARIDFFLEKQTNKLYLNEINTLPGFTPISMFPRLFEVSGISPSDLLSEIVALGYSRFEKQSTFVA
ncbi:MAG: D-alanine--D-alanine ligase [Candidatus Hydrogenedentota bacterium]|nr:MAG: D-alanine--D-alanine ligase [Candidatus Hydrogenedentota bacterium]